MGSEKSYVHINKLKGNNTTYALMLETSFWWMSKSKKRLFKHSSKLEWVACKHNLSIGMQ